MSSRIVAGRFDAEKDWGDNTTACLPAISSPYYKRVVAAMDELLIAYCTDSEDVLLTKASLDPAYLDYLSQFGIKCRNFTYEDFCSRYRFLKDKYLDTYAVTDEYIAIADKFALRFDHPDSTVVKKVNSKFFSVELSKKLGINDYSHTITETEAFKETLKSMIKNYGRIILKEEYGVSGKGNMIVDEKRYNQILKDTLRQTEKGKRIRYIIEPLFEVKLDFSSQWSISDTGEVQFVSIQEIRNHGSAYGGSVDIDQSTLEFLRKQNYFSVIEAVCNNLYMERYYGDVCIDSMIINGNQLIPVVEINARKSMSLTKIHFDNFFNHSGSTKHVSCMLSKDIGYQSTLTFDNLLNVLKTNEISYNSNTDTGVIPISCNTVFSNRDKKQEWSRGRLYCYARAVNRVELEKMVTRLEGIKVFEKKGEI